MDGRLLVERINGPFRFELKGTPAATTDCNKKREVF